jgi:hypothetical protein
MARLLTLYYYQMRTKTPPVAHSDSPIYAGMRAAGNAMVWLPASLILLYAAGYMSSIMYLSRYSFPDPGFTSARHLASGASWALFVVLPFGSAAAGVHGFWYVRQTKEKYALPSMAVVLPLSMIALNWFLVKAAVLPEGHRLAWLLFWGAFCAGAVIAATLWWHASRTLGDASIYVGRVAMAASILICIVTTAGLFARYVYPWLRPALGGGAAYEVVLKSESASQDSLIGPPARAFLIDQTPEWLSLAVCPKVGALPKLIAIPRTSITQILDPEQPERRALYAIPDLLANRCVT